MSQLTIEITTPERTVFKDIVDAATIPTTEGEITVLPHHVPVVSLLAPGALVLKKGKTETDIAVSRGFVHVEDGAHILILADSADRAEELDLRTIEEAKERAQRVMKERGRQEDTAFADAAAALERELARLKVVRRRHKKL